MIEDARILRDALRAVSHVLTETADEPRNWRDMTVRQHAQIELQEIDREIVGAHGNDHLATAAARLLLALQVREHERQR